MFNLIFKFVLVVVVGWYGISIKIGNLVVIELYGIGRFYK